MFTRVKDDQILIYFGGGKRWALFPTKDVTAFSPELADIYEQSVYEQNNCIGEVGTSLALEPTPHALRFPLVHCLSHTSPYVHSFRSL